MNGELCLREFYGEEVYRFEQLSCPAYHMVKPDIYDKESVLERLRKTDEELLSDVTEGGNRFIRAGAFIGDKMIATVKMFAYNANFDGKKCEINGIADVLTDPDIRRSGAITKLYKYMFEKMNNSGQVFSHLYPFTMAFYRKYGYELCCREVEWTIPSDYLPQEDFSGLVRYDNDVSQQEDIKKVFQEFIKMYNLSVNKSERMWNRFFKVNSAYTTGAYSYIHYTDGVADGFISYRVIESENDIQSFSTGNKFYFTSQKALIDLLSFMGSLRAYYKNLKITLPENIDISYVLSEICGGWGKKNVKKEIYDIGATRIVNVKRAFEHAKYNGSGKISVKVNDKYCPWNDKIFEVEFDGECCSVCESEYYDIELDIGSLTALLLGFRSAEDIITMPNVKIYKNTEDIKKVFYKKNVWIAEHF